MLEPLVKTIQVPCNQQRAFDTFVRSISSWWPLDKNSVSAMSGAVAKTVVIEPSLGGKVYEIGHDLTEHHWGSVIAYQPNEHIIIDWHLGLPHDMASEVSVSFNVIADNLTEVVLSHSRWEAFGDKASEMRTGYDHGWAGVFENSFHAACTN